MSALVEKIIEAAASFLISHLEEKYGARITDLEKKIEEFLAVQQKDDSSSN